MQLLEMKCDVKTIRIWHCDVHKELPGNLCGLCFHWASNLWKIYPNQADDVWGCDERPCNNPKFLRMCLQLLKIGLWIFSCASVPSVDSS